MPLLVIHPLKKGINAILYALENFSCPLFLEDQPFYPNALLQVEITSEDKHGDSSISLPVRLPLIQNNYEASQDINSGGENHPPKEILVYSQRPKASQQGQSSNPEPSLWLESNGNNVVTVNDLDVPMLYERESDPVFCTLLPIIWKLSGQYRASIT